MASPRRPGTPATGAAAWLAVAEALRDTTPTREPDANLLAAWLEGRLDEAEAAPVETWIAHDPAASEERLAVLRRTLTAKPGSASPLLLLRLRAMRPQGLRHSPSERRAAWRLLPQAAGMAAAVILAVFGAYGGYELGVTGALAVERAELLITEAALADFALSVDDLFLD